ncbi:high mobility group protein B1, partial [Clonorchis sinensis]
VEYGANMMVKDKNRPKHPMSAYACFVQVIREEHRKKHPNENVIFSEFSKKCAEKWKQMSNEQRRCFEEMAKLDLDRFNREMAHYVPPAGMRRGRRRRRTKDPAMPKRSWSAFFFFCDAFRSKIRNEHPDWKVSDIAKELGRRWEECTDKEKYERHAQNDKLRYEQDMQKYKAGIYVATKRARVEEDEDIEPSCVTVAPGDSHRQANDTTDGPAHDGVSIEDSTFILVKAPPGLKIAEFLLDEYTGTAEGLKDKLTSLDTKTTSKHVNLKTAEHVCVSSSFSCTTLSVPSRHATRRKHGGSDTAEMRWSGSNHEPLGGRRSPQVPVNLMSSLNPNWTDFDKYTHLETSQMRDSAGFQTMTVNFDGIAMQKLGLCENSEH